MSGFKVGDLVQVVVASEERFAGLVDRIDDVCADGKFTLRNLINSISFEASELKLATLATNPKIGDLVHVCGQKKMSHIIAIRYCLRDMDGNSTIRELKDLVSVTEEERVSVIKQRCDELRKQANDVLNELNDQLALLTTPPIEKKSETN